MKKMKTMNNCVLYLNDGVISVHICKWKQIKRKRTKRKSTEKEHRERAQRKNTEKEHRERTQRKSTEKEHRERTQRKRIVCKPELMTVCDK